MTTTSSATTATATTTTTTRTTTTTTSTRTTTTSRTTTTTTTSRTTTTTGLCSPACNSEQTCVLSICTNVGHLGISMVWSRSGDGDIAVATPNRKVIYYNNKGPSSSTDQGELDRDDLYNRGPENIYWPLSGSLPPAGTYYLCFEPYSISPTISSSNPITVTYQVVRPTGVILTFTKTFTSLIRNSYNCDAASSTLMGSFTYP
ncbi:unnamed protein product [Rotaria sp. Silwood1]|nr:unnamed protein product [Rotaria sp. Silwood1]